jgi:hypothetical protein
MLQRIHLSQSAFGDAAKRLLRHDTLKIIGLFILYRVLITIIGAYAVSITPPDSYFVGQTIYETHHVTAPGSGRIAEMFVLPWFRWDTGWYLKIAALGYSATDGTIIFPPLYPALIRVFSLWLFNGDYLLSGLLLSNVFSVICFVLFYKLTKQEMGSGELAWRSLIYLIAYPSAFFFAAAYSESTFLVFVLAAWVALLERKWICAGILAGFASLARLQGWLLAIPFFWFLIANSDRSITETPLQEVKRVMRHYSSREGWKELFSRTLAGGWAVVVLPVFAYLAYTLWLAFQGMGSIPEAFSKYWGMSIVPPWVGLLQFIERAVSQKYTFVDTVDLILFLIVTILCILAIPRLRIAFSIYLWITFALILMRGYSTHLFPGFLRYALALFPIFWVIPQIIKNKYLEIILLTSMLLVQFILLWMFLNWYWVA